MFRIFLCKQAAVTAALGCFKELTAPAARDNGNSSSSSAGAAPAPTSGDESGSLSYTAAAEALHSVLQRWSAHLVKAAQQHSLDARAIEAARAELREQNATSEEASHANAHAAALEKQALLLQVQQLQLELRQQHLAGDAAAKDHLERLRAMEELAEGLQRHKEVAIADEAAAAAAYEAELAAAEAAAVAAEEAAAAGFEYLEVGPVQTSMSSFEVRDWGRLGAQS